MLTASEKQESMLGMTNATSSMDLSKDAKRAMEVLSKAKNSASYIYNADYFGLEDLHEASAGKELLDSVYSPMCDLLYNLNCQSELENTSHNVLGLN